MKTTNYNIHNLLTIRVNDYSKRLSLVELRDPFEYFIAKNDIENPNIEFNIQDFLPTNADSYFFDNKYNINEDYFFTQDSINDLNFKVEIKKSADKSIQINFWSKSFKLNYSIIKLLGQEMFLFPLIINQLFNKEAYLLHSAAICDTENGYIFNGLEGSHKSSLVINAINNGYSYMGDDWIILTKNNIYAFPKNLSSFIYSYQNDYLISENNSITKKVDYLINNKKYKNDSNIKIQDSSKIKKIYILNNSDKIDKLTVSNKNKNDSQKITLNNKIEFSRNPIILNKSYGIINKYILYYSLLYPSSHISNYFNLLNKNIEQILTSVPTYNLSLPNNLKKDFWRQNSESLIKTLQT